MPMVGRSLADRRFQAVVEVGNEDMARICAPHKITDVLTIDVIFLRCTMPARNKIDVTFLNTNKNP
jgi:hypothetical protein